MNQSDPSPKIVIISDEQRTGSPDFHGIFSHWQWELLRGKILRSGIKPDEVTFHLLAQVQSDGITFASDAIIIGLGEKCLRHFTEKRGIDKWQLSPLKTHQGQLFIPTFDLGRVTAQFDLALYLEFTFQRAAEFSRLGYNPPEERFHLNPELEETYAILDEIKHKEEISCDVETGYGQINTVGFAWSPNDAIAINTLPSRCGAESYFILWNKIREVLEGPSRKIFQNFIYDVSYFSAYGIHTENIHHDTMWGMKFLYPELKANLGNVGRIYTRRTYWKDDGKVTDEEGAKKDWGNVRDWSKHYQYNCRDTTGTFESYGVQRADLESRGLDKLFYGYLTRLIEPIREMCATGFPLDLTVRDNLKRDVDERITRLTADFHRAVGSNLNPRSPKQVLAYLKEKGASIPKKYDKTKGVYRESADSSSIKKIRLKRDLPGLAELQQIKTLEKALSSYIDFEARPDGRLSYSLNGAGTETLRWSGNKDPWDRGFNIQTIPRDSEEISIKSMFVAPPGFVFCDIDLRQAESRFVAYDSADKTLIDMLESGADVHTHVGRAILKQMGRDPDVIPKDEFKATWRQLGKKAGHGLNYFMKPTMFAETVFNELDIVISKKDAELITQAYYDLFPGIPRWHQTIRNELYNKRKLTAPSGWERYFYGRYGDDMFKEAFAWRPQHTIPWIMNHLMLHLTDLRRTGSLKFQLLVQTHDSLTMLVPEDEFERLAKAANAVLHWHPEVILPGGKMIIPIEIKSGPSMDNTKEWVDG